MEPSRNADPDIQANKRLNQDSAEQKNIQKDTYQNTHKENEAKYVSTLVISKKIML